MSDPHHPDDRSPDAAFDAGTDAALDEDEVAASLDRARVRREVALLTGLGVVLTVVFGTITYRTSWVAEPVYEVVAATPDELQLAVGSCGPDRRIEVTERDDEVAVLVRRRRASEDNDCIEYVAVRLESPIGDRRVIDRSDDVPIPVCPMPGAPRTDCTIP